MSADGVAAELPRTVTRRASAGYWSDALWRVRHDLTTLVALGVLVTLTLLALGADLISEHVLGMGFADQDLLRTYAGPSLDEPASWLGHDTLGRSQLSRMLYGARVSLFIGIFGAVIQMTIGVLVGLTAGYFRGWWDDVAVWVISTISSIPILYLLIMVGLYFRLNPVSLAILIGAIGWLNIANLARGQTFALRERDYVTAARTIGASSARIMSRHVMPNFLPLMIVVSMVDVGGIILAESALSFLGFGIQPPVPSWGNMLSGASALYYRGPHLIIVPGIAITGTVLCLFLVGDGLRDALDPRLRGTGSVR